MRKHEWRFLARRRNDDLAEWCHKCGTARILTGGADTYHVVGSPPIILWSINEPRPPCKNPSEKEENR